jgi:hypothetical protein
MTKGNYIIFFSIIVTIFSCRSRGDADVKLFSLLPSQRTGITFNNLLEETHQMNVLEYQDFYSGGGVSIGDVDNDGLSDIFFTGNQVPARLYKNKGNLKFEDVTGKANLAGMGRGWYTGTSMVDINHDGYLDIYISKSGMEAPDDRANLLYINNGDGTFTEMAKEYGIDHRGFAVNASFFDYDRDGDLDMYLVNQGPVKIKSGNAMALRHERHQEAGDVLYENVGDKFIDVTERCGLFSSVIGFAHGVSIGDINDDGWEDIFVSNDFFEYDYLYINNQDKTFTETIKNATAHISYYSMGNDMADYNNDGLLDIVVLDMIAEGNRRLYSNLGGMNLLKFRSHLDNGLHHQYMSNVLHMNNGNGIFSDVGTLAGISRTDWSWAAVFADFDNDGWKDLYVTNGIRKDVRNIDWGKFYFDVLGLSGGEHTFNDREWDMLLGRMPFEPVENYMFKNSGDLSFEKVMDTWGMGQKSWSNGVAFGDLDNDGDLDLVVNNIDQEAFVYENNNADGNYIRFSFSGPENNLFGLGTKVRIGHGEASQYQQNYLARGYRSSMEPVMHFGVGQDTIIHSIEVTWPNGKTAEYHDVDANQVFVLDYRQAHDSVVTKSKQQPFFFASQNIEADARHEENDMEDFMRAPTLPYKLSSLGPALAVGDVNGDGKKDFYLGGAFRRPGKMMVQNEGSFQSVESDVWNTDRLYEDVGAAFLDVDMDGDLDLYVASGGSENTAENGMLLDRLYANDGMGNFSKSVIPEVSCSSAAVLPFDFDQDGDMDLFVGGRQVPGQYPMPADSYLLKNEAGKLQDVTDAIAPQMRGLGLVTDAVWSDYDGDGDADLLVVGEWMQVTLFENRGGKFEKKNNKGNGLDDSSGWWWSIASDDFDGDGDPDFVLGNMGYNYKHKATSEEPLEAFAGDFNNDGQYDLAMGYYQDGKLFPVYDHSYALLQDRDLVERIPKSDQYSISTLHDIYGEENLQNADKFQIQSLATSYIENLGNGKFEIRPFHKIVQISTVNSILTKDVDHDGNRDIIMAGNLYPMDVRTVRNDASIGLWLRGDGRGNFNPVPYSQSGLNMPGDVRHLEFIEIGEEMFLLAAKNNDLVQFVKINDIEREDGK